MELTQAYLKSILDYDPDTGVFTWLPRARESFTAERHYKTFTSRFEGRAAGCINDNGYIRIRIQGKFRHAHRMAFLWMANELPPKDVDHINGVRHDNRWSNLRAVTRSGNMRNTKLRHNNQSGCVGVSWDKRSSKWHARIHLSGKSKFIGLFTCLEDAVAARQLASINCGFHENHGRARTGY